jgi:hypothetical protein
MFTAIAAATLTASPFEFVGCGVEGSVSPDTPLLVANVFAKLRLVAALSPGVSAPDPLSCEPFALASAVVAVVDQPVAMSSTVPVVVNELAVVAETEWFAKPRARDAPTAASVPFASPVALVVTGELPSVACALKFPLIVSVARLPTPAVVEKFETVRLTTGVTAVPPAAPPVAVVVSVFALVDVSVRSSAETLALPPTLASVVAFAI